MLACMKRSRKIWLGVFIALVLAVGGFFVWAWEPWNPITRGNCLRVERGMTMDEVTDILGEPTRVTGPVKADLPHFDHASIAEWHDDNDNKIYVYFDRNGLVKRRFCDYGDDDPGKHRTFRERVRRWLGWDGPPMK
jgi:hypothetical protein